MMASIRKTVTSVGEDVKKLEPSCIAGGDVNGQFALEKSSSP